MTNYKSFIIIIFSFLFLFSCKQDNDPNNLLSKKEFISIMIDIHKTDALLSNLSLMDNKLSIPDSMSYYNKLFQDYGITREQFYNTFRYYTENMADFLEIEKIVMDSLNQEYQLLDSLERLSMELEDLWTLKREWNLPKDGVTNSLHYKHVSQKAGNYTISAQIKSYPDDLSKDLQITIGAYYVDGTKDIRTEKILVKNATWKAYSVTVSVNPNKRLSFIEGEILSHSHKTTYMHVQVKDIMLTYTELDDAQADTIPDGVSVE